MFRICPRVVILVLLFVPFGIRLTSGEEGQTGDATMPEVVVTASGEAQETLKVPVTVNTVTPERAVANDAYVLGETLNQVPGVYSSDLNGVTEILSIRQPITVDNYYLFLEDGIPLQPTVNFVHTAFAYSGALTSNGGMEVLKGPGTALYGSDAVAAVVNVKSLEPTSEPSGRLLVGMGMFGGREVRTELSGGFTDTQSGRVALSYDGEDGWRDQSKWDRYSGILRHRYKSERTQIDTILLASSLVDQMPGTLSRQAFKDNPKSDGLQAGVDRKLAYTTWTVFRLSSAIQYQWSPTLTFETTPYLRTNNESYMEVWNPSTTPIDKPHSKTVGALNRVHWHPTEADDLVVGTDLEFTAFDRVDTQTRATVGGIFGFLNSYQGKHYDYDVDYAGISPYLQYSHTFQERFIVEAGLRYDYAQYDYRNHLGPTTDPNDIVYRPASRVDQFNQFSPKFGLAWRIVPTQSLFARYAHGFRLPKAQSLYSLGNGQAAFTLKPETIDSYEIGWKGRVPGRADWELDGYWMESHDGIVNGVVTPGGTISANGGRKRFRGIEAGGNFYPGAGFEIGISYSHSFNEIVRALASGSSTSDGKIPNGSPDNLANIRLGYRSPMWSALHSELEMEWLGQYYMDDANTKRTPDEVIFHLRESLRLDDNWTLSLKALNLFNLHYATNAARYSYGDFYSPGAPFSAAINMEGKF